MAPCALSSTTGSTRPLGKADDAQTGAEALLGIRLGQDLLTSSTASEPIAEASLLIRSIVQSAHRRCADCMCSGTVVYLPLPLERRCAAIRSPLRNSSTVRKLGSVQLLILDDWGLEPLDDQARHDLLEIL